MVSSPRGLLPECAAVSPHATVRPDATLHRQTSITLHLDATAAQARQERVPMSGGRKFGPLAL